MACSSWSGYGATEWIEKLITFQLQATTVMELVVDMCLVIACHVISTIISITRCLCQTWFTPECSTSHWSSSFGGTCLTCVPHLMASVPSWTIFVVGGVRWHSTPSMSLSNTQLAGTHRTHTPHTPCHIHVYTYNLYVYEMFIRYGMKYGEKSSFANPIAELCLGVCVCVARTNHTQCAVQMCVVPLSVLPLPVCVRVLV